MPSSDTADRDAPDPIYPDDAGFNGDANLPYGCRPEHVRDAMVEFCDFLEFINQRLTSRNMPRLEDFLMPAGFSSLVGEFINMTLPKYCATIARNTYHNGHPDLLPKGQYDNDAAQHAEDGIEVKASRQRKGWQGHNPEDVWLMVFVFDASSSRDALHNKPAKPFRFVEVFAAELEQSDWKFSGRSGTSRRTITASVTSAGYEKMAANWIYRDPRL